MAKGGRREGAGRKPSEPRATLRIRVSSAELDRLCGYGEGDAAAGLRKLVEVGVMPGSAIPAPTPRGPVVNADPAVGMKISPYSGKPLCPDCQRKGANIHCRACGANARGAK